MSEKRPEQSEQAGRESEARFQASRDNGTRGIDAIPERKRAEAVLRESEERYHSLVEMAQEAILILQDEQIRYCNPAGLALLGAASLEDLLGRPLGSFFPPDDAQLAAARRGTVLATGRPAPLRPFRLLRLDNQVIDIESSAAPCLYEGKAAIQIVFCDLTEHLRTAQQLRKSQASLEAAQAQAQLGSWELDLATGTGWWSAQMYRLFGCDPALGPPPYAEFLKLVHPEDRFPMQEVQRRAEQSGATATLDFRTNPELGPVRHLSASLQLLRGPDGRPSRLVGTTQDVTRRKRAEEALRESEELFRQIAENLREVFWVGSPDKQQLDYVSPAYEEIWGRSVASLYQEPLSWLEAVHPDDRERVQAGLSSQAEAGYVREYRIVRPDGSVRWIRDRASPVRNQAGEVYRLVGVAEDITAGKQGEEALRVRAKQLEYAQRIAQLGSWEWDVAQNRITWSDQLYHIFGLHPDEFAATFDGYLARVHPDDRDRTRQVIERALRDRQPFSFEERIVRPDGVVRVLHSQGEVAGDEHGRPVRMAGTCQDVTERKQAEEALRESEARYRAIFDNAVEGFFQTTPEGSFLRLNPALARIYGYESPEEVIAQLEDVGSQLYVDPGRRQEFVRLIEAQGSVKGFEFEIRRKNGSRAWVSESTRAVRDGAGRLLWYEGTVEDVTERKQAEQALRQREAFLRMSQQIGHIGSWDWDMASQQVTWSDEMYRIYGITPEQFDGSLAAAIALTHPDDRALFRQRVSGLQAGGESNPLEYRITHPDGTVRHVLGKGDVIRDPSGRPRRMVGIVMDVTENKRAEEERRKLEAQVLHAQKLESLGLLAGGIAHDFNNLLTAILGYANLARMHLPADAPAVAMLQEIERGSERAADLAQQMLAYSGRGKFVIRTIALDGLVREMSKLLQTAVCKKAVLHLDLEPARIEGDVTQIRQVVMNLITNASDALGGQEGVIAVHTGVRHCTRAALQSPYLPEDLPEGAYAFVEVRDSGCGMSSETLQRIFDPFFTTKSTGRGLGLAAVLGIVRGHRGTLQVTSSPGQGTTFEVLLPLSTAPGDEPAGVSLKAARPRGQGLVLVVEDEECVRSFARSVLESAGFGVLVACHGLEGVTLFEQYRQEIVAVVLDLMMPHMDGLEVAQRLNEMRPGVPILLMSGYNEQETMKRFAEIGVAGFLQKPFRPDDLISRVCQMLPEQAAARSPRVRLWR